MAISWDKGSRLCDGCGLNAQNHKPACEFTMDGKVKSGGKCANCKINFYLHESCQQNDWQGHKPLCQRVKVLNKGKKEEMKRIGQLPLKEQEKAKAKCEREFLEKFGMLAREIEDEAIETIDGFEAIKKFVFSGQLKKVYGPETIYMEKGKKCCDAPDMQLPEVRAIKLIELRIRHEIAISDAAISLCDAKIKLKLVLEELSHSISRVIVFQVLTAVLSSHIEIERIWSQAFAEICTEDPDLIVIASRIMQVQKDIKTQSKQ